MGRDLKSASSGQAVPLGRKIDEAARQFFKLAQQRNPFRTRTYPNLERDLIEYRAVTEQFGDAALEQSQIFEIGCGQRPYRLFYLIAHGLTAQAIDMDRVVFRMGAVDIRDSWAENGAERTLKTLARYYFFDLSENRKFKFLLSDISGAPFEWPVNAITRGDATDPGNWPDEKMNFIYSEDVFEHIPQETLPRLCAQMAAHLTPDGVALIRPMIFTGIQGGHNVEYYNLDPATKRNCPPWDHLRGHRFPANTFLNRMTLADYRTLFSEHFEIIEETVRDPDRGRPFLTPEIRQELSDWPDEELFSNHVGFILKPRKKP